MTNHAHFVVNREPAVPSELVSFTVVCEPQSHVDATTLVNTLDADSLYSLSPEPNTLIAVIQRLSALGFEVFTAESTEDVFARGRVDLFESTFKTKLEKQVREVSSGQRSYKQEWFVVVSGADIPQVSDLPGALYIALTQPPLLFGPMVPAETAALILHVPGDIGILTRASATHRRVLASGDHATGAGIAVAIIDTGFYDHPFYRAHGYNVTALASPDTNNPTDDSLIGHGTAILAGLVACAPDAIVTGIKKGDNDALALSFARGLGVKVISLSWGHDLSGLASVPRNWIRLPLKRQVLLAAAAGITVVAAAGDDQSLCFPAAMPEVLAIGGVAVDTAGNLSVWDGSSSFISPLFPTHSVPDFCGLASETLLPVPPQIDASLWLSLVGTSCSTPQVAGIVALLLQKRPLLTTAQIKTALFKTATDIRSGKSATLQHPRRGPDEATGAGLVNALDAWLGV